PDFSGFNKADSAAWMKKNRCDIKKQGEEWLEASTEKARTDLEKQSGVRYSELQRLDYFDPVRQIVVDPMHNLFSGTAKRMTMLWASDGFLLIITVSA
ncbi:hypothetical protein DM01DRAFT_1284908, partial [Hesseltinella vesiculosa]